LSRPDNGIEVLTQAARFGDKVALVTATRTMTFHELHDESDRVATALLARGLRPGQAVSLYAQNRWGGVVSYHGALKASAVVTRSTSCSRRRSWRSCCATAAPPSCTSP
jgi:acyl-CoA synthetase (AMP-forming)/AMP-acid ligase II